jgi:hypothetical protein
MPPVYLFFSGATAVGFLIAAAFFLRYWLRTREPLLLIFSAAFALLSLNNFIIGLADIPGEEQGVIYLMRLSAFVLIIVGIIWTNLRGRSR